MIVYGERSGWIGARAIGGHPAMVSAARAEGVAMVLGTQPGREPAWWEGVQPDEELLAKIDVELGKQTVLAVDMMSPEMRRAYLERGGDPLAVYDPRWELRIVQGAEGARTPTTGLRFARGAAVGVGIGSVVVVGVIIAVIVAARRKKRRR